MKFTVTKEWKELPFQTITIITYIVLSIFLLSAVAFYYIRVVIKKFIKTEKMEALNNELSELLGKAAEESNIPDTVINMDIVGFTYKIMGLVPK